VINETGEQQSVTSWRKGFRSVRPCQQMNGLVGLLPHLQFRGSSQSNGRLAEEPVGSDSVTGLITMMGSFTDSAGSRTAPTDFPSWPGRSFLDMGFNSHCTAKERYNSH
jgi:hypothetical protein